MIGIDLQNRQPLYEQIIDSFQTMIASGILEAGSQMPSVRSLAMELSINPRIIQKAYALLEQEGFILSCPGKGSFVSKSKELKEKRQETVYRSLRELVKKGKELDILCEDFVCRVRQYYEEGEVKNDPD